MADSVKNIDEGSRLTLVESMPKEAAKGIDQPAPDFDLNDPNLYINRELGWLEFNHRVLDLALDDNKPLLERVKFLAIAGSNMDEFFMKRIGGLKQQVAAGVLEPTVDGRTPQQQIEDCYVKIYKYLLDREHAVNRVFADLAKVGVVILTYADLSETERQEVRNYYYDNIFPLVTPQSVDPAHPFPFISNLSLNLLVTLRYPGETETSLARVKVPVGAGACRFQQVGTGFRFVPLEEVMANNLDLLFPGMEAIGCEYFRVTRNANTSKEEEHAEDLLAMIESALHHRKFAPIVRLQVKPDMDSQHRGWLAAELGLDEIKDVYAGAGMLGMRDLAEIQNLDLPELKEPPHHPIDHPLLTRERNIFHIIREQRAILLQHPYESFSSSVARFLYEAASDPKVRGIKMTLYRTDPASEIITYLIRAAQNGKQVTVVVELKASFSEQANINLATRMEEAGVHVTYGVVGLKTHAKVILVIRQDYKGLRRYVHIGTGNYHSGTARLYSDLGLFLYDKEVGRDTTELFNYLTTGFTPKRNYTQLIPAPKILKKALLEKIEREIAVHSKRQPGLIRFKMNALEDIDIARALYRASQTGVKIDLLVRDSCRLRPGIHGLSENIRVVSIVGRFLEHARIYYFQNAGSEEFFVGSVDTMKRSLENRVEILVPVISPALRLQLQEILDLQLNDSGCAWELQADGCYRKLFPAADKSGDGCQERMIRLAEKRLHEAQRLRKRKAQSAPTGLQLDD